MNFLQRFKIIPIRRDEDTIIMELNPINGFVFRQEAIEKEIKSLT